MHFITTTLTALLATSALASPTRGHWNDKDDERKEHWAQKWDKNDYHNEKVFHFDKTFIVKADPDQVRNGTTPVAGQPGAKGLFKYGIIVEENTICYSITLSGVTGEYFSAAKTATHIHEAAKGASGPPRLAFPNPEGPDERRVSYGCLTGPFTTGIEGPDGKDTGTGFHVEQIVANPAGFFTDSHTVDFPLGAVRGQLS